MQEGNQHLLELIRNRHPNSVPLMYDRYAESLFGVILNIVGGKELAEEVLQDTFTKAWRNIDRYDRQKGRLYTWLVNIARNSAIDATRSKHFNRPNEHLEDLAFLIDIQHSKSINTDTIGIKTLVEVLSIDHKTLIDLIYFKGFTQAEVALYLSIPEGTVKTRLRAAIKNLKKMF